MVGVHVIKFKDLSKGDLFICLDDISTNLCGLSVYEKVGYAGCYNAKDITHVNDVFIPEKTDVCLVDISIEVTPK